MSKIQLRGHCPHCGNEQAVLKGGKGGMSQHGYTVDFGYFHGVCRGNGKRPMEFDRAETEKVVAEINADIEKLAEDNVALAEGRLRPTNIDTGKYVYENGRRTKVIIKWEEAEEYFGKIYANSGEGVAERMIAHKKESEVKRIIRENEWRIKGGKNFIKHLENVLEKVHGKPLIEVDKTANVPEPIRIGEKRVRVNKKGERFILKAVEKAGARIYYTSERNGKTYRSWEGVRGWRNMEKVEA